MTVPAEAVSITAKLAAEIVEEMRLLSSNLDPAYAARPGAYDNSERLCEILGALATGRPPEPHIALLR